MVGFRELRVWQDSKALSVRVYKVTLLEIWNKDWGLRDQIRRAAVSVPSNIAEGEARKSQKDSIRFFKYSLGSLAELSTQFEIACEIGYLDESTHESFQAEILKIQYGLGSLVKKRSEDL